ncbi:MAG: extracellular solute-binding protein, partial [Bacillota bacterium]|nr:extracellular solute-binding protein [Bacillota bacterium]
SVTSGVSKLQGGQAAALIDGTWDSVAIKSALGKNFAVAKLPTININGTATQTISLMGYKMLGVNKNTKYPNTAHALAQFLTDKTSQIDRVKDLGWGPSNKEAQQDPAAKNDPAIQAVQEQAQYSLPQTVMVGTFWDPMAAIGSYLITEKGNPLTPAALTKLMNDTKSAICE